MKNQKVVCRNMNHGRLNPPVEYCPSCGARFKQGTPRACDITKHKDRRKHGDVFCCDCGKDLKTLG